MSALEKWRSLLSITVNYTKGHTSTTAANRTQCRKVNTLILIRAIEQGQFMNCPT
jgi:hypothetical protein